MLARSYPNLYYIMYIIYHVQLHQYGKYIIIMLLSDGIILFFNSCLIFNNIYPLMTLIDLGNTMGCC